MSNQTTTLSATMSPELFEQVIAYRDANPEFNQETAPLMRTALQQFADNPPNKSEHPVREQLFRALRTAGKPLPKRNRVIGFTLNTALHERMVHYANTHKITISAVIRRAVYEYTKPTNSAQENLCAKVDGWCDNETNRAVL
jgi:hypothetical protein